MTLVDFEVVSSGGIVKQLDAIFDDLTSWCALQGISLHMVRLTKDQVGMGTSADYPAGKLGLSF